jgi:hypothetical protein
VGFLIGYKFIESASEKEYYQEDNNFEDDLIYRDEEINLPEDLKNTISCGLEYSKNFGIFLN